MWSPVRPGYGNRFSAYLNIYARIISPLLSVRFKSITMKYLNVAEKNDAAKNIAIHLCRTPQRREGFSKFNKIYEFEAEVLGQKSKMVMTSVSGHLLALDFVISFRNWNSCHPESLFSAPITKYCPQNYENIKKTLEQEIRSCDGLIIWTDCDREGENIGFEIIKVCTERKRNLAIYRAKFSEITPASVHRALRSLGQPNKNISDAVEVRQELDLRIGAAFTRFQTQRLSKVFPSMLSDNIVSYGSCQFPTLGFVVERYRAMEDFVPENFWKLSVQHTIRNITVKFTWERGRLFDKHACEVLYNIVMENPTAKVININTHPKSKWRPLPLDTVELEKLASRKLKINAKETMRLAEKLYTQGFISYPRTETNQFPKDMNLGNLVQMQTSDGNWGLFAQRILDDGGPNPRQGRKTDMAHPPIHPTKYTNNLSGNEFRLYEFIVRSFLACCYKDAQGVETTVTIDVAGEGFTANGLVITEMNYLDVYPYDNWTSKEIHHYQMNSIFTASVFMEESTTSPPSLLTEADLIALMEKHGIGTDATHAEHIEKIKSRKYVDLSDGIYFVPTVLGMGLIEGYDAMELHLSRPHLRAHLETDLKAISEGQKQPDIVLAAQIEIYRSALIKAMQESNKLDLALGIRFNQQPIAYDPSNEPRPVSATPAFKCPMCAADMMVRPRKNSDQWYIGCSSFPNCKNAVWFPSLVKKAEVLQEKCPICGPNYNKIKFEWKINTIEHLYPLPYVACIGGCDDKLLELLRINISSVNPRQNTVNINRSNSGTSNLSTDTWSSANSISNQNSFQQNPRAQNSNLNTNRSTYQPYPRVPNSNFRNPRPQNSNPRMPAPNNRWSNQNYRSQGPNRGRNVSGGLDRRPEGPRPARRCGLCRQEGHTRNHCPQRH